MSELVTIIERITETCTLTSTDDRIGGSPADPGTHDPELPLERLKERICELAAHLAAGTVVTAQFAAGRMSYAKVRALTGSPPPRPKPAWPTSPAR